MDRNVHVGQVIHCSGTVFVGYDAIREDFFRVGEVEDGYFRACNLNGPSNWYSFNLDGTMRGDSLCGSEYGGFRVGNAWKTLRIVSFDSPLLRAMEILSGVDVGLEGISKIYSLLTKVKDAGELKEHLVPQELRCVPAPVLRWEKRGENFTAWVFGIFFEVTPFGDIYHFLVNRGIHNGVCDTPDEAKEACQAYWQQLWDKEMLISRDLAKKQE